jgi:hypothetical protein
MRWNRVHRFLRAHIAEWEIALSRDWGEGKKGFYYHLKLHNLGWPSGHEIVAKTPGGLLKGLRRDSERFGRLWRKANRYQKKHGRWALDDYLGRGNPTEEMVARLAKKWRYRASIDGTIIEGETT